MTIENDQDLTQDEPFDFMAEFDRLSGELQDGPEEEDSAESNEEAADDIDVEDGPEESGELNLEEDDDSEIAPEDGIEEEEEPDTEEKDEGEPVAREPEPDPRDKEIDRLTKLVEESQQRQEQILEILALQQQSRDRQPQKQEPDIPLTAVQAALFGGGQGLDQLDPQTRTKVSQVMKDYMEREARFALDPRARYVDLREQVMRDVYQAVGPLLQSQYDRTVQESVQKFEQDFQDPGDKARLREVLESLPGGPSTNPTEFRRQFEVAAKQVKLERLERQLAEKEQKVTAAQRQKNAAKRGAKRSKRGRKTGRKTEPVKRNLDIPEHASLMDIMQAVQEAEG